MVRRKFLWFTSKAVLVAATVGTGLYSLARALVPDILYEPSPEQSIGKPEIYAEGVTILSAKRLFVVREGNDFFVLSAVCTHLGCTVNYVPLAKTKDVLLRGKILQENWEFSCPCHGSKYYAEGTNYSGPAPKPLPRFHVDLSPITGELIVNTGKQVDQNYRLKI